MPMRIAWIRRHDLRACNVATFARDLDSARTAGTIAAMPPLALVVCPLPADRAAARAVQALLGGFSRDDLVLFCPEPYQAPAAWERTHRLLPLADLPLLRSRGDVSAPIYVLDGGPGESVVNRCAASVPGVQWAAREPATAAGLRAAAAAVAAGPTVRARDGRPRVEAMVLAYKSKHYISPCLQSLLEQDWPELEITVLDNHSDDGTADFVRQHFPSIDVLEADTNLGFAAGHNLLFDRTRADYVALLNHDAIARRNWVSELVAAAEARPDGAAFGAKMLMRRCPTILNSTGIVMNESGFAADRDIGRPDLDPSAEPERVFAACGGALLLRGSVLRRLGGFDPTFFMYVEDVDWCWRARLAGHEIYYVPSAACVHDWHGDMAAAGRPAVVEGDAAVAEREGRRRSMVERNRLQAVYKNYERRNLLRVWRELNAFDRGRLQALAEHVARGGGPMPARVLEAVRSAHAWCRSHRLGMWLRRRRTQRLRRVADATFLDLVPKGMHEPSGVGDLYAIVDRYCAVGRAEITMATADAGSLGPGWHHPEPGPEGRGSLRWSMAECWFYLRRDAPWSSVHVSLVPQPLDTWAELRVDGLLVARLAVAKDRPHELRWTLPAPVPAGQLAECRIVCAAFVPRQHGMGDDARELGLHVATMRCE
ncbi:MAG TPA: glycosyltransferase family 2 protein [Planctomycetota bacterium]|nr:glycosyltransferase family 2 protein [Planctomycetota bacterium]